MASLAEKNTLCKELGELGPLFQAIRTPVQEPNWAQVEKTRNKLMNRIENSRCDFLTTLKDKLSTTDSLCVRVFVYVILIIALAILAVSAFFVFEALISRPVEAAAVFTSFFA